MTDRIKEIFKSCQTELSDIEAKRFYRYYELLVSYNENVNLTAITEFEDVIIKHFIDSVYLLKYIDIENGAKIIDIGTGAGFPGVPLLILRPDLRLTLVDSLRKRCDFLEELLNLLGLNAEVIHSRSEDLAHDLEYRAKYDYVTSRAVAKLNTLLEYSVGFIKTDGYLLALKSKDTMDEIKESENALNELNCKVEEIYNFELLDKGSRSIVKVKKTDDINDKYPRRSKLIQSKPL